jgi:hypothetical protein
MYPRKTFPYVLGVLVLLTIVSLVFPFSGGAAPSPQNKAAVNRDLPNYDAFGASQARGSVEQSDQLRSEAGHLIQSEPRLGVPTFLWASDVGPARSPVAAANAQDLNGRDGGLQSIARDHLARYASRYRLTSDDVAKAIVSGTHDTGKGPIIVKFRQEVSGVEVFRDQISIIMNRDLQLVAISGYLTGDHVNDAAPAFSLQPTDAIAKALGDLTATSLESTAIQSAKSTATQSTPYQFFTADRANTPGFVLNEPVRSKQVMYHLVDGFVPAYYIETNVNIEVPDTTSVDLSGTSGITFSNEAYSYVISAVDGQVLFRKNLTANDVPFTYRVWADPVTKIPYDTPAGNDAEPKLVPLPDGTQYPFVAPNDVTLQNYPFSRNDPWLPAGATETVGNNADAYLDLFNPDGFAPAGVPGDPATADFRAQITAPGQFLHTHTPDASPATAEARQASIQQLFYNVNFLHDWFYEAGFDEASGNAQLSNFGRGGLENDRLRAEGQDVSNRNNANMTTPADGTSPRMQMFVFDPNAIKYVDVLSPAAAAGKRSVGTGQFGQQVFDVTNQLVQPSPAAGCTAASFTGTAGKFVMVDREPTSGVGSCSIGTKLNNAMAAGAAGFILVNLSTTPNQLVNVTGSLPTFTIPFLTITWNDAASIKTQLAVPTAVQARMRRDAGADRDGTIDNQIVFHEWGHYISNRLIGNAGGLNTTMSSGMGEGWGDFTAMLLTVRENDSLVASNPTFNGTYALANYATSGGDNNAYYFGIRRYPYSTDLAKNPLTFKHIQNGVALPVGPPLNFGADGSNNAEVHNTGEVWASMLWECYASLLRDTQGASPRLTFNEAQQRMKYYLVAAYKMTPSQPTFLEARDAVLAAAFASDPIDYEHFFNAFAKRGAGFGAISPDRFTLDNVGVTESFTLGSDATFSSATLDDAVHSCDLDGVLDSGETGHLVINLRNTGVLPLTATTGTVTPLTGGVTLPNGGAVNFSSMNPQSVGTATLDVTLATGIAGVQALDFKVDYNDPEFSAPRSATFSIRTNTNTINAAAATDTVEGASTNWTVTSVPPSVVSGGFTFILGAKAPFQRKEISALQHVWHVDDIGLWSDERLSSPVFTVDGSGSFNVQFDHSFNFEFDAGGNYDGGVVEISVNGGAFSDLGGPAYNGTILNYGGANNPNPIKGRTGFVQNSAGTIHTSLTQAIAPGSTVQIRYRVGTDGGIGAAGWNIDNISFTGVVETPFPVVISDPGSCPAAPAELDLSPSSLPEGTINSPYPITALTPSGGSGPYTYSITPFGLPPGLVSDVVGGNLQISGTPTQGGTFPVSIVVNDSASHHKTFNYSIIINKLAPVITWNDPLDITHPTALSATQLNASANVPGTLTYIPAAATVLNAGNAQVLTVNFVPTDANTYSNASKTVHINVLKATPVITWNNPADITYPAALSATQLNAIANVPGVLTYTPPATTVLNAGNAQTLSVNFVPTDTVNYSNTSKNVQINVLKATPVITWNNPADITYPATLSGTQLNATASVPGVLTYTPPAATVLNAGNAQTLSVNFVPTDTTNYSNTSKDVHINVLKATTSITWSNPAKITYPPALSATQLNATASVPGTLTYTPPAATILNAGNNQTLSVNFVPTDSINYSSSSKSVSINVLKATPTITWNNPADITYLTALGGAQLNATSNTAGTFIYTPSVGFVLNAGNAQNLSVTFTPTNTTNFNNASKNVSINVLKANQTISFGALLDRPFGSAPFAVSGSSTSNLPLAFSIQSGPATINNGTITLTGVGQVTVRASQSGNSNFNSATPVDRMFNVTQSPTAVSVISSVNPSVLGQSVTFTATVVSTAGMPTGTVTFKDGGVALGSAPLNGSGIATFSTSSLTIGSHVITAEFDGDANSLAATGTLSGGQSVTSPPNGVVQFSASDYFVSEAAGSVAITVTRTGNTAATATVDYWTDDTSVSGSLCSAVTGAASNRCDYTPTAGTLHFAAGEASKTFTVLVTDDGYVEGSETLQLTLNNPGAGSSLGSQATAVLTITDDDGVAAGNPNDNASRFVEQLYHDFLNRAPDSSGLAFWTAEITVCGTDQACIVLKRQNVAAAFFLSVEFQQTGYLVERIYKTSYGDATGTSALGGAHSLPVPVIRFNEFLPDTQKIGLGVTVGQPGWEASLENNKQAFLNEFVTRSRFTTAYPLVMTNATFVDTLNVNAGNPLSTAEQNQLVSDLDGATKTRAQVVRAIAEHANLVSAEFNRAFVLMQYFGFLRRNPHDLPDVDYSGYDFWLTKLNQFNGNYADADMVKAFITSAEYRHRFGN